jgi:hypothetical protein
VLLRGGFTDSPDFTANLDALASRFRLLLPERLVTVTPPTSRDPSRWK